MKKVAILTSGGDSQGMNAAARAVAKAAMYKGWEVYGIVRGYKGLVEDNMYQLSPLDIANTIGKGGTFLKTARLPEFKDPAVRAIAAENLKKRGIEYLVVIGGDGSFHGAHYLYEEQGIKTIGIPGTIDNDIAGTDFTIGYDTTLNIVIDAISKLKDTARSHDRTMFLEVMGRSCGDIALNAGMAAGANGILIPEIPYKIEDLVSIISARREKKKTYDIVVVAEGVGHTKEIAAELSKKMPELDIRVNVLGHVQRGGEPSAFDRLLATRLGVKSIELLDEGFAGIFVGVKDSKIVTHKLSYAWENYSKKNQKEYEMAMMLSI